MSYECRVYLSAFVIEHPILQNLGLYLKIVFKHNPDYV